MKVKPICMVIIVLFHLNSSLCQNKEENQLYLFCPSSSFIIPLVIDILNINGDGTPSGYNMCLYRLTQLKTERNKNFGNSDT